MYLSYVAAILSNISDLLPWSEGRGVVWLMADYRFLREYLNKF